MNEKLRLPLIVIVVLIAGVFLYKCQFPPGDMEMGSSCVSDTVKVYDTIRYTSPTLQSELALGTRPYNLQPYYFKGGGSGGEPRAVMRETDSTEETEISADASTPGSEKGVWKGDSVELPLIQRHYADSTYEAWVSGPIDPRLDSIRVFAPTSIITKREWKPPKHWHIGPSVGIGYTAKGFQPYIGISLTYSILSF